MVGRSDSRHDASFHTTTLSPLLPVRALTDMQLSLEPSIARLPLRTAVSTSWSSPTWGAGPHVSAAGGPGDVNRDTSLLSYQR
jgi:hypothetical protein